ncbi:MAG: DNA-processing protein DprA [Patescibacteria group bacterium]|jgi:DNA processing protein
MINAPYLIALSQISFLGPSRLKRLIEFFPDLKDAWIAKFPELLAAGFNEKEATDIILKRQEINPEQELKQLERAGIKFITSAEANYPRLLKEIYNAPPLLYYRGNIECLGASCLGVVGARKHTAYGQQATEKIVAGIAQAGITVISGLALGIDALAHKITLDQGGLTAAVLGSDLSWDNIGPKANFHLAEKILASAGCLVSEFPLGVSANRTTFPQRNRLISGLSSGVLVIEAGESSGSLITANYALEQNRDVFAVPGSIFSPCSAGTNNLIKKGAKSITEPAEIIEEYGWQKLPKITVIAPENKPTEAEKEILEYLSAEPLHLDKIVQVCNIRVNTLSSLLMIMSIKGLVKDLGGGNYIRI